MELTQKKEFSGTQHYLMDEFEEKFVRLKPTGKNQFEFSYFRHTGQWFLVAVGLTMEECRDLILSNPNFQPI